MERGFKLSSIDSGIGLLKFVYLENIIFLLKKMCGLEVIQEINDHATSGGSRPTMQCLQ